MGSVTLEKKTKIKIQDSHIQDAIEIRCSDCYAAMNIANAFSGTQTVAWQLLRKYELPELIAEAKRRNLPIGTWRAAVDTQKRLVIETLAYLRISQEEVESRDGDDAGEG